MTLRNGMAVLIIGPAFGGAALAQDAPATMTCDGFNGSWHVVKD
jgi:hypothetical protein